MRLLRQEIFLKQCGAMLIAVNGRETIDAARNSLEWHTGRRFLP